MFFDTLRVAYLVVLKAASSSIKFNLSMAAGIVDSWEAYLASKINLRCYFNTVPGRDPADYFYFTFVRNPYDRLISGWNNKIVQDGLGPVMIPQHPERFRSDMSFPEFVQAIRDIPDTQIDTHFRSQCAIINSRKLDFVGRFETFDEDWARVCQLVGIPNDTVHANRSCHRPYREYYDETTKAEVTERFKNDLERFGYVF